MLKWLKNAFAGGEAAKSGSRPAGLGEFRAPWPRDEEIAANLAVGHLRDNLIQMLKSERGVHAETLMVVIGSIAGHAAAQAAHSGAGPGKLMQATVDGGGQYYFGDALNAFLVPEHAGTPAIWTFVAAAVVQAGVPATELPSTDEMFAYVTQMIGKAEFGALRVPDGHTPAWPPRESLDAFWPTAREILSLDPPAGAPGKSLTTRHWPTVTGIVAQQYIGMTKEVLDPRLSARLIMESAIFMSKVDPKLVPQQRPTPNRPS